MNSKKKTILVLGSTGMLGEVVFKFLKNHYPNSTWGSVRDKRKIKKNLLYLSAISIEADFRRIIKKLKKVDYVINCIAVLNVEDKIEETITINTLFPHQLERLSEKYHFKLIHVSTDSVFPVKSKKVSEKNTPKAESIYSASKLLGEVSGPNSITVRSSFLGLRLTIKGNFFQKALKEKTADGFTNQKWAGSTTFQFARFCYFLTQKNNFTRLRKVSGIYHFTPLSNTTRYRVLLCLSKIKKDIKVGKNKSSIPITRTLISDYFDKDFFSSYTTNIQQALQELFQFEKMMKHE